MGRHKMEIVHLPPTDYPAAEGSLFIKDGKIGERYVIGDRVYTLESISDGTATVTVDMKRETISLKSEGVLFDDVKHKQFLFVRKSKVEVEE